MCLVLRANCAHVYMDEIMYIKLAFVISCNLFDKFFLLFEKNGGGVSP